MSLKKIPGGFFVAFEGPDSCGKSDLSRAIAAKLSEDGYNVLLTAEPTDFQTGSKIRRMLTGYEPMPNNPIARQRLYVEDRAYHLTHRILPALSQGSVVLSDRYWLSTLAYGMLAGLPPEPFIQLHQEIIHDQFLLPHLTLHCGVTLETIRVRKAARGKAEEFFEREGLQKKVITNYRALLSRADLGCILNINANGTREEMFNEALGHIMQAIRED